VVQVPLAVNESARIGRAVSPDAMTATSVDAGSKPT
jgi:hypothetical protein